MADHFSNKYVDLLGMRDAHRLADLLRGRPPDAVDGRETDLGVLVLRDVDAGDACHVGPLSRMRERASALALLVARVRADHAHHAVAADDLAVAAHLLDRSGDFHGLLLDLPTWRGRRSARDSNRTA